MATTEVPSQRRAVREALRRRAEAVRRRELDAARSRLDAHGDLTDEQREVLDAMARSIVDGVLAEPRAAVERAEDDETVRVVRDLFVPPAREG
ncbi:MAG: glutamyl-tRNA reductase [Haloferacaceae archaeon]